LGEDSSSQRTTMYSSSLGSSCQPMAEDWEEHFAARPLKPRPVASELASNFRSPQPWYQAAPSVSSLGSSCQPMAEDWEEHFAARPLEPRPVASELASSKFRFPTTLVPSSHPGLEPALGDHVCLQQVSQAPCLSSRVWTPRQSMLAPTGRGHEPVLSDMLRFSRVNKEQTLTPRLSSSLHEINTCLLPGQNVRWSPASGYLP
jgi:hypothetical protein